MEEGFDFSIGALPVSYPNLVEVPLCPYEQVICCAPSYLEEHRRAAEPGGARLPRRAHVHRLQHAPGNFEGPNGPISAQVHPRVLASDSRTLRAATLRGLGITVLPRELVEEDLRTGTLVQLLTEFPVQPPVAEGTGALHEDQQPPGARSARLPESPQCRSFRRSTPAALTS